MLFKIFSMFVLFGGVIPAVSLPIAGITCAITGGLEYIKLSLGFTTDGCPYVYITSACGGLFFFLVVLVL